MSLLQISRLDEILETATNLFKSKGYVGTSMRDLADAVGMEAGSLYSHVDSKDELLQHICFTIAGRFNKEIDLVLSVTNCSTSEKLESAINGHVKVITEDINATSVFWNEWKYLPEPHHSELSKLQVVYEHKFRSILDEGVNSGEFKIADTTFTTMGILSSLNGLQKWRTYSMPPEDLGSAFAALFITGIKN